MQILKWNWSLKVFSFCQCHIIVSVWWSKIHWKLMGEKKVERTAECITSVWIFVDKSGNLEESAETDCWGVQQFCSSFLTGKYPGKSLNRIFLNFQIFSPSFARRKNNDRMIPGPESYSEWRLQPGYWRIKSGREIFCGILWVDSQWVDGRLL